jgi:2,3-bisphosphoglycerate-dependent phosphoglycerate mutase
MPSLILIRHCESSGQAPGAPLTEQGARDAEALGDLLAELKPDAIYSSDYERASATVGPLACITGLVITMDPRLRERTLAWSQLDDWLDDIRRSYNDHDYRAPGGETLAEVQERGLAVLTEIIGWSHRLPVVVSHGGLISYVLRAFDPTFGFDEWRALRNPDLFKLSFEDGRLAGFRRLQT